MRIGQKLIFILPRVEILIVLAEALSCGIDPLTLESQIPTLSNAAGLQTSFIRGQVRDISPFPVMFIPEIPSITRF